MTVKNDVYASQSVQVYFKRHNAIPAISLLMLHECQNDSGRRIIHCKVNIVFVVHY